VHHYRDAPRGGLDSTFGYPAPLGMRQERPLAGRTQDEYSAQALTHEKVNQTLDRCVVYVP
jgi:hypothetical protein